MQKTLKENAIKNSKPGRGNYKGVSDGQIIGRDESVTNWRW